MWSSVENVPFINKCNFKKRLAILLASNLNTISLLPLVCNEIRLSVFILPIHVLHTRIENIRWSLTKVLMFNSKEYRRFQMAENVLFDQSVHPVKAYFWTMSVHLSEFNFKLLQNLISMGRGKITYVKPEWIGNHWLLTRDTSHSSTMMCESVVPYRSMLLTERRISNCFDTYISIGKIKCTFANHVSFPGILNVVSHSRYVLNGPWSI